jgi:hypothetical protein
MEPAVAETDRRTPDASPDGAGVRLDPRLVGLNAALLAVLAGVTILGAGSGTPASAQGPAEPGAPRGRGDYTMVAGRTQGSTADTIYIIDAANQDFIAMQWNRSAGRLEGVGYRSLGEDSRYLQRPR